jgi:nitronate monooxygenase
MGIELPIIQAPMAGVQDAELAAAVSNAGGLGSLPCAMINSADLRVAIAQLQAMTDKPFNVNFFCHDTPTVTNAELQQWTNSLKPYFLELGIQPPADIQGSNREPFGDAALEVLGEFKPAVVSFHFGLPGAAHIAQLKRWGLLILASATTVEEARWLAERGVDGIIAQGLEAGGHRGSFLSADTSTQSGTMALVPQICANVSVPVIAAGGIASPEGVRAAMMLGAVGVQAGTVFLMCPESKTGPLHRAAVASDASGHTALTNVFTGRPARSIVNRLVKELGPMSHNASAFPTAAGPVTLLRAAAEALGRDDFTPLWCGQNAAGCAEVPAGEMLRHLATGC